ncbi:MAG: transcription-repair coupling factor, partial [Bacteroidia bacterium]|nr:transcription-repair coupling factor [Bacteroidia bacterium]
ELKTLEELAIFKQHLIDRFGELPKEAEELLKSVQVKWLAKNIGFERLILKKGKMIGYFISDQQSPYYQTETFTKVLQFVQQNMAICKMKEKDTKQGLRLLLTFDKINSIDKALHFLSRIETKR